MDLRFIPFSITPVDEELISGEGPLIRDAPVNLHGNMYVHWQKRWHGQHHRILVFDTVAESLRQMCPPAVKPEQIMQLFDMDGTLAASSSKVNMTELRIFALLDYKAEVWSFQFRIKLPVMEIERFQEQGDWSAKIVSGQCDVLVSGFGWLLHSDKKGNLLAKYQYDDDLPVVIPLGFKESLIQHTLFPEVLQEISILIDAPHFLPPAHLRMWLSSILMGKKSVAVGTVANLLGRLPK